MSVERTDRRRHCPDCRRPLMVCYCALIRRLANRWPVTILQHSREARHALGTARIASLGLTRCERRVLTQQPYRPEGTDVLVYPGSTARPLEELWAGPPRRLLFLDASWRKSRRMLHEQPDIAALPRFQVMHATVSRYRIRKEPAPGCLSTLEAVVLALEAVEQAPGRYQSLLQVMDWMVDQQIQRMGETVYRSHHGGREP